MMNQLSRLSGVAAGVPFIAVPPQRASSMSPIVVAWHMMDPPRTESAFASALPLSELDAWRIYLGLPMSGSRLPAGGFEELMRLGAEDPVLKLQGPVITQAAGEFPEAFSRLREQLGLGGGPIGLVGGSVGSAVAQLVIAESEVRVAAAVLVSPMVQLRPAIDSMAGQFGFTYPWPEAAVELANRLDFVARVDDMLRLSRPAVLLVVGADDEQTAFGRPATLLHEELVARYQYGENARLTTIPGMGHALADEPGLEPAPQTPHAQEVDRQAAEWLRNHLQQAPAS